MVFLDVMLSGSLWGTSRSAGVCGTEILRYDIFARRSMPIIEGCLASISGRDLPPKRSARASKHGFQDPLTRGRAGSATIEPAGRFRVGRASLRVAIDGWTQPRR